MVGVSCRQKECLRCCAVFGYLPLFAAWCGAVRWWPYELVCFDDVAGSCVSVRYSVS